MPIRIMIGAGDYGIRFVELQLAWRHVVFFDVEFTLKNTNMLRRGNMSRSGSRECSHHNRRTREMCAIQRNSKRTDARSS
jgi:hypothetical protein